MAVPRNRLSKSRTGNHRAHHAKKPIRVSSCPNCQAARLPHTACLSCGHYRGRSVMKGTDAPSQEG